MSILISQGGFGCIYYPGITCDGNVELNKKYLSKLQKKNFNSKNEVWIGKIIQTIPNYELYFIPIISECTINLHNIKDKTLIKDCAVIKNNEMKGYTVMKLKYIKNKDFYKALIQSSHGAIGKKKTILSIIESYSYLLYSITQLIDKEIVHLDLKGDNVLYNMHTGYPLIIDFGISIPIKKLIGGSEDVMKQYFYGFIPEYYVWPLDVHIINYLLHETDAPLTNTDAKLISMLYCKSNKALFMFSPEFRSSFETACIKQINRYVGKLRQESIDILLKNYKTWDIYSLSIMYLKLFGYMFPLKFHRNSFIILFSQILLLNMNPDPQKRLSAEETEQSFRNIFYTIGNVNEYENLVSIMDYDKKLATEHIQEDLFKLEQKLTINLQNKTS